jgi:nucleoside-diphosphate-sugar epimerase
VILRPSIVYGPHSRWCTNLLQKLREGKGVLIEGGKGVCNTTYVDNLVDAIFLAADNERAVGGTFFITDDELLTWGQFIQAHVEMLEPRPILSNLSTAEILSYYREKPGLLASSFTGMRRILVGREFRDMLKEVPLFALIFERLWYMVQNLDDDGRDRLRARLAGSGGAPIRSRGGTAIPDLDTLAIQTGEVFFRIEKARTLLGYEPRIPFSQGIRLTELWLRWANHLS